MNIRDLKNKKIGILGYGTEGKSVNNFLRRHGLKPMILDNKPKQELDLPEETDLFGGAEYLSNLEKFDIIFRSPGIPRNTSELAVAEKEGVQITSQTKLFFDLCPCIIIGITGTKGKGTTATLVYKMLKAASKSVFLGGNIGIVPLDFLDDLEKHSIVVLELSSFQLQDLHKSPAVSIVLSVTSDHLNHHKNVQEYATAKTPIASFQKESDFVIYNSDDNSASKIARTSKGKKLAYSLEKKVEDGAYIDKEKLCIKAFSKSEVLCNRSELALPGLHSAGNVLAACLAALAIGVNVDIIRKVVKSFSGLPHRLETIGVYSGVTYVNDSLSTLPDSTIAALSAFNYPIILIAGGSEKHADYKELGKVIGASNVKALITLGATGPKISAATKESGFAGQLLDAQNLTNAVELAKKIAQPGDMVLLSPASASFDMFANAKERGERFKQEVKNIANT